MQVKRRWIARVIETAKAEARPLPWVRAKAARRTSADRSGAIRTTLAPKLG